MSSSARAATATLAPLRRSVRLRGVSGTCVLAARWGLWRLHPRVFDRVDRGLFELDEWLYDRRHGVDTRSDLGQEIDDASAATRDHGVWYEATGTRTFAGAISLLPEQARAFTFVDLGCGKGRVLLQAAEQGFPHVVGVDHSATLIRIARSNAARFGAGRYRSFIRCEQGDAGAFDFPDDDLVVYMFNPFDDVLMRRVVSRLIESLESLPRRAVVLYFNPVHANLLTDSGRFHEIGRRTGLLRSEIRAYRWC